MINNFFDSDQSNQCKMRIFTDVFLTSDLNSDNVRQDLFYVH